MVSPRIKNLNVRIISALVVVGILAATYLFFDLSGIVVLTMILEVFVIREGLRLISWAPLSFKFKIVFGLIIYLLFTLILFIEPYRFHILVGAVTLGLAFSIQLKSGNDIKNLQHLQTSALLAFIYLALFPALLIDLLFKYQGLLWFLSLLIMVFAGDIGAYAFGITLGKHHVLPLISPKKTWEGAFGGFLATILSALSIHMVVGLKIPLFGWLFMSAIISIVAQSGDFFESLLKRIADVKDSGTMMPGHGGILDRIDGLLFAAPIMSIALTFFDHWI